MMPASSIFPWRRRPLFLGLLVAVACLGVVSVAGAGKPSKSAQTTLTAVDPYERTALFATADLQAEINASLSDYTVDTVHLFGGYTALDVDSAGALLVEFEAYDGDDYTTFADGHQDLTRVLSGIATYEPATDSLSVKIVSETYWADGAEALDYGDAYPDEIRGSRPQALAIAPTTAGGLQADDVVVVGWVYDEDDARGELQVVRLARSAGDADEVLAGWPAATFGAYGNVGIDTSGRVYLASAMLADYYVDDSNGNRHYLPKMFELSASGGTWTAIDVTPSIGMQSSAPLAVAEDGTLYTVAPDFGDYDAEIHVRDPDTGEWSYYAQFDQRCCIREFRALAVDGMGVLFAAVGAPRQSGDYIAQVVPLDLVTYSDRLAATTAYGVEGLVAEGDGVLYCVHQERDPNAPNLYTDVVVYRLTPSASGGGGNGGGGNGGGKGKNK